MTLDAISKEPVMVPQGAIKTPFHDRFEALSHGQDWGNWSGYLYANVLKTVEVEYFAIRNQATLFDISPMCKYRVKGPDAERVMNRMLVRDVRKIRVGRVGYAIWCDEEGMVIDDGTVFRLGENDFLLLCQEHMFSWLHDCAWGFDAAIIDESNALCGLALQGPTSYSVLKEAGLGSVADMKPFDLREVEPGLWISRTGYTGDLGYELLLDPEGAHALWDRLWAAGENWGLIGIGVNALKIARLEVGFLSPGEDFQSVHVASRVGRGRTPFEIGFGKLVNFDKGHFNGRRALLKHQAAGPRYHLVRLDIAGKEPAHDALIYAGRRKKPVGHVTSAVWSPTAKRNIALAELKAPYGGEIKDGLWAEIYVNKEGVWHRRKEEVRIESGSFLSNPRSRKTPPLAF